MPTFTLADFLRVARHAAGEDGTVTLDEAVAGRTFDDLDLDSLSVVAIVTEIEQELDVRFDDDVTGDWTPERVIERANALLGDVGAALR